MILQIVRLASPMKFCALCKLKKVYASVGELSSRVDMIQDIEEKLTDVYEQTQDKKYKLDCL